jgi:transposase
MAMRKQVELMYPNAAGIDVGASSHYVAVPAQCAEPPVRQFGPMTDDLHALAEWLLGCGVQVVAMESTGVYWIPLYEVLERRGLKVWLVDARAARNVPGRKSDVLDCQWLQRLMSFGLLSAAHRPADAVCVVRAVVRSRETLLTEQARCVQRMQKALVQMNVQLTEVLSDVAGVSGQAIIRAMVAGERDAAVLARLRHQRVKAAEAQVVRALSGNWREEHLFVLGQALALFDAYQVQLAACDAKLQALLAPLGTHEVKLGAAKGRGKNAPGFDARTALARWSGVDLTRINGISTTTVLTVLSEVGPDLSRFASVKRFCSWLGLCPGTKISGGQRLSGRAPRSANRVKQALKMAAMSLSHSDSALGAFYRKLCTRMDKARANTAAAHKLARMIYFMLTRGEDFVDRGQARYEQMHQQRALASLKKKAAAMGFQLVAQPG